MSNKRGDFGSREHPGELFLTHLSLSEIYAQYLIYRY
jgi:hypothetical protein